MRRAAVTAVGGPTSQSAIDIGVDGGRCDRLRCAVESHRQREQIRLSRSVGL